EPRYFCRILVRHQPRRKFRMRLGRYHRLCALADIASPYPVEFERRPAPELFDNRVALLATERRSAHRLAEHFLLERQPIERLALGAGNGADVVVEAGYGHAEILIVKLGKKLAEDGKGIGHRAAKYPRVQVL